MDKSWIWCDDKLSDDYTNGVKSFIELASHHLDDNGKTRCPCRHCRNVYIEHITVVERHLWVKGFSRDYRNWIFHGEPIIPTGADDSEDAEEDVEDDLEDEDDDMIAALEDAAGGVRVDFSTGDDIPPEENTTSQDFSNLFEQAEKPLYPGCTKFSVLTFIVKLMHIKVLNRWSNKSFDMLLQLLREAFPEGTVIGKSLYEVKRMLHDLGLGYESIDACKWDCALFWKENKDLDKCPVCGEPRYKYHNTKGKHIPHKVLRYFPVIPRLQRLFKSRHTAVDMTWHKDKRPNKEGFLTHPADGEAWKHFDEKFPTFAAEPRNIRLGLATDGFNPFGNMSNGYSMWPVILVPYNMPSWRCMKENFFIMSLLVPGPQAPGKDMDVYLRPLIDELKELWDNGVMTYDVSTKQSFNMHAAVLWSMHDFPAYGTISGWSTKGYKACPVCNEDTSSQPLRSKICYMGHRRYLPIRHAWRNSRQYDGKTERRTAPRSLTGGEILDQLSRVRARTPGKHPDNADRKRKRDPLELNWTKKSIFYELQYWSELKLRHILDVMHIEKNICDNVVGTMLGIEGKSKDTIKARMDLEDMGIREHLHLQHHGSRVFKPLGCYSLTSDERREFCKFIKSVKFPDGFAANISNNVKLKDGKIVGLKTHDCHVLFQRLLPLGIRPYVNKEVSTTISEFAMFFQKICARTLSVTELDEMQEGVVITLCKLEKIFPPAFFDVMVHLAVHLPYEAKLAGPVHTRWMYPFERYLGTLKKYVKNKARPEGSIAEGYVTNEALTYCSMYLRGIETQFNRPERTGGCDKHNSASLSVFTQPAKPFGSISYIELSHDEMNKAHWYILYNCTECEPYIDEHTAILENRGVSNIEQVRMQEFPDWFKERIKLAHSCKDPTVNDELFALACGPDYRIKSYSACDVNGVRYRTKTRDARRVTQNCGIWVEGESCHYYGVIEDIFELTYIFNHKVELFKCTWFDTNDRRKNITTDMGITSINVSSCWYENEPYVLARQACQVFYVDDYKMGQNWKVVQKFHHRRVWGDDPEKLDDADGNDDIPQHTESEAYQESSFENIDITFEETDIQQLNREDVEPIPILLEDEDVNQDTLPDSESDIGSCEDEPLLNSDEDSEDDSQ